ncbi:uncharacterized protein J4E87_009103 [Alternaria ethzedia]|uniref:uncharacterized protein n=3 Tax=Alternaria sect. Infectoriae TaxID=2499258 RepID=UPI0020C1D8F4|nr:uncharacterized protein J4E87_009103 [Alternaria ethzedia]KAI4615425.1 hypothetical protein J4E87_009103 [Alternaria ethzedia]
MSQFRAAKLDIGCFAKIRNIRDHTKRKVYSENEPERQALRYLIRNTTLPQRVRAQAQLQLSQMHCYTRYTQIKNRCIMGGKGRGVFSDFRMGRYQFRVNALAGNLPGVKKATDLNQLGFFINLSGDIRMIDAPEKPYVYHATNNERVNEVRREAMQTCQRKEAEKRLSYLGLECIHLPDFAMTKPNGPHVPILAPPPDLLKTRKRLIVLVNDTMQDLGILAYRQLQRELGINGGSVVNFAKEMVKCSDTDNTAERDAKIFKDGHVLQDKTTTPALIVLNAGQLLYSHKYDQAMTLRSWSAMPRKSIAHDMVRIRDNENRVPGHENAKKHVKTVFDEVICNPDRVAADAEVYVIAIEDGTESILNLLTHDFGKYGTRITAMAFIHSLIDDSQIKDEQIRAFMHQRTRQWRFSDLTCNPQHCVDLPTDYNRQVNGPCSADTPSTMQSIKHMSWHASIPTGPVSALTKAFHSLALSVTSSAGASTPTATSTSTSGEESTEWSSGQAVICPTFAGGDNSVGECIFTYPPTQHAILSFFQDVAQDPVHYRNPPGLQIFTEAPKPSPENPLALSSDHENDAGLYLQNLLPQTTSEHAELDEARERLAELQVALSACPTDAAELDKGRVKLEVKVKSMEAKIEALEIKALSHGGLAAGEVVEKREDWKPQVEGPQVPFAGTMVDSELLKAAGLMESVDEEKAFV